jgi:hypothetical protein
MKLLLVTILLIALPITASATVDFLSVNKITKEYYWGDEDNPTGWIGWRGVPEAQLETAEDDLKKLGYTETFYPYKIESCIASAVLVLTLGQYIIRKRPRKNATAHRL